MLQSEEISQLVFQARKDNEAQAEEHDSRGGDDAQAAGDSVIYSSRDISFSDILSSSTWDPKVVGCGCVLFLVVKVAQPRTGVFTTYFYVGTHA